MFSHLFFYPSSLPSRNTPNLSPFTSFWTLILYEYHNYVVLIFSTPLRTTYLSSVTQNHLSHLHTPRKGLRLLTRLLQLLDTKSWMTSTTPSPSGWDWLTLEEEPRIIILISPNTFRFERVPHPGKSWKEEE